MKVYTKEHVKSQTLKYFNGNDLSADVWMQKYALKNYNEEFLEETPDDMHKRLAAHLAAVEAKYPSPLTEDEIYQYLKDFQYIILQGSPMSAIGNPYKIQSLGNCFVVESPFDSYGGILKTDQELAQISKRRGGVGTDISTIRPKGLPTKNAAITTDGIGVFMERFSNTIREVGQGGRRGALMLTISIHHPEVETFIDIKKDMKKVTGANLSVRLTDEFMRAVESNSEFELKWPVDSATPIVSKLINAKYLWDKIISSAWESAEPGLLFWDRFIQESPPDIYEEFRSTSTNPCSELNLSPYDSCRLTLINLCSFVSNKFRKNAKFDFSLFEQVVRAAQRLMDDIVDLEIVYINNIIQKIKLDPEPEEVKKIELSLWEKILEKAINGRRTGLGITGLGDVIAMMNLKYGSKESVLLTHEIYSALGVFAHDESIVLAKERGHFPSFNYELEKDNPFLNRLIADKHNWQKYGRRNVGLTTTAPAGSVSLMAILDSDRRIFQTTSGIEPAIFLSYMRRRKINPDIKDAKIDFVDEVGDKWQEYPVHHPGIKLWLEVSEETDISKSPYHQSTAMEIDWVNSVELQAAAQKWVDHSISKTCNLPNSATKEIVSQVYLTAWRSGCKGFTVYRDGCRTGVLVSSDGTSKEYKSEFKEHHAIKRPKQLPCELHHVNIKGEKWLIIVGLLDGRPYEVFGGTANKVQLPSKIKAGELTKTSKKNGFSIYDLSFSIEEEDEPLIIQNIVDIFDNVEYATHTRLISLALRHGTPVQYLVEQLQKDKNSNIFDFSKVIARCLKKYIKDGVQSGKCENCSSDLVYKEGCVSCINCEWSKCS